VPFDPVDDPHVVEECTYRYVYIDILARKDAAARRARLTIKV
jgi:hypothetical protein